MPFKIYFLLDRHIADLVYVPQIKYGITAYEMRTQWMQLGILGTVAFVVLIITSLRPVRKEAYELFFLTHFVMAL